ncbi:hypothetical protein NHX12_023195 [Muraenolepis orangiensis]|uniref:EF-hand domain-containing protein n=1 Tax=Muraenolepis orangiensis TaxID=630683 RepID=A0A9Q0IRU4_9TELE|nr:hypothetical protein NHX12_023195 [Muraenolepis orangiensis]
MVCPFVTEMSSMNRKVIQNLAETISKQVKHFNRAEVERLIRLFYGLLGDQRAQGLDRGAFRSTLHNRFGMTDDMLMDGGTALFRAFDKDNDGFVSVKEWAEDCFDVYDLNGDGFVSREEMFHMLKNSLIRQLTEEDPDEGIKDLVEITVKKMDHDHDGRLSFADFEKAVKEENLLLEAFGSCLPDAKVPLTSRTLILQCYILL